MKRIDAHIHFLGDSPAALALLAKLNLRLINISVTHSEHPNWHEESWTAPAVYRALAQRWPERYDWITTIGLPVPGDRDYAEKAIALLAKDFAAGAVGLKIWKNIGMEVKLADGRFMMIDDPIFTPIYEYLTKIGQPLLLHIGEPLACWRPLDPNCPHYGYYSSHPQWHMYNKPGFPSHGEIMAARDRVIAAHPKLRVIGAHLGSHEYDVAEVAKRFDAFPNYAVDISARLGDLAFQDPAKVRAWIERYPDRILWGTDDGMKDHLSTMPPAKASEMLAKFEANWARYTTYFESSGKLTLIGRECQCLGLPPALLERLYTKNALAWYPALRAD